MISKFESASNLKILAHFAGMSRQSIAVFLTRLVEFKVNVNHLCSITLPRKLF